MTGRVEAFAPGRVNLIGEHTDYTGGLVLPMALEMGIRVTGTIGGGAIDIHSEQLGSALTTPLPIGADLPDEPSWGRYVAAVARHLDFTDGFQGSIESSLPEGGTGLSSSSALTVAIMLAFGALDRDTVDRRKELADLARIIEADATGVQSGIMDQLIALTATADHATMIDCHTLDLTSVAIPESIEVLVFHSGQPRKLADSEYNARRATCELIEREIGPLRTATPDAIQTLGDPVQRKRGRHVVTENQRVLDMVEALAADDPVRCGELLDEGHRSLSEDYEVSTPQVDAIQARVAAIRGVYGARMVGGGFGGSLVAFCEPGTDLDIDTWWLRARPGSAASVALR